MANELFVIEHCTHNYKNIALICRVGVRCWWDWSDKLNQCHQHVIVFLSLNCTQVKVQSGPQLCSLLYRMSCFLLLFLLRFSNISFCFPLQDKDCCLRVLCNSTTKTHMQLLVTIIAKGWSQWRVATGRLEEPSTSTTRWMFVAVTAWRLLPVFPEGFGHKMRFCFFCAWADPSRNYCGLWTLPATKHELNCVKTFINAKSSSVIPQHYCLLFISFSFMDHYLIWRRKPIKSVWACRNLKHSIFLLDLSPLSAP